MNNKIALYWWAFNPPTIWHFQVIQKLLTLKQVDKILFCPDWYREDKNYWISCEKRIQLINIFFQELINMWLNVELLDHFLNNNVTTTTIWVDEYIKSKFDAEIFHIFWIDVIDNIKNWSWNKNWVIQKNLNKIFLMRKWYKIWNLSEFDKYKIIDLDVLEISSTTVRGMIKTKISVKNILSPWVFDFVLQENLYSN